MTITFVAAASATTSGNGTANLAAPLPAGIAAGDLLIAAVALATTTTGDTPFTTVPTGWTSVAGSYDAGNPGSRLNVYSRVATGSEGSTATWSATGVFGHINSTILAYRGASGVSGSVAAVQPSSSGTGGTEVTGTLTVAASGVRLLAIFTDPRGSGQTYTTTDTQRSLIQSSNTNLFTADTNGTVATGSYSKTVTVGTVTSDGVSVLLGLTTSSNVAPTVSAGANQTGTVGSPVTLTGTATDTDGTIASRQWTPVTYPGTAPTVTNATSAAATYTPTVAGVYVFQFSATDNSGATSTDTTTVYVPAAAVTVISEGENSGAWTGAYTDLADTSDSTYVQSSGSGSNTYRLAPIIPNSSLVITVRAAQTGTGATLTITLLQGGATIAGWTRSSLTSTPTDFALALTSTQVASITNWNTLDIRFS